MNIEFTTEEARVVLGSVILLGDTLQKGKAKNDPKLKAGDHDETIVLCDTIVKKLMPLLKEEGKR